MASTPSKNVQIGVKPSTLKGYSEEMKLPTGAVNTWAAKYASEGNMVKAQAYLKEYGGVLPGQKTIQPVSSTPLKQTQSQSSAQNVSPNLSTASAAKVSNSSWMPGTSTSPSKATVTPSPFVPQASFGPPISSTAGIVPAATLQPQLPTPVVRPATTLTPTTQVPAAAAKIAPSVPTIMGEVASAIGSALINVIDKKTQWRLSKRA